MPAPPGQRTNRPLYEVPMALADMFAGAGRGVARGTLGLPGDLESLVRLGIGGQQQLPTSQDFDDQSKWYSMPPLNALIPHPSKIHPYDTIGMFYNLPIYGGAAKLGAKGLKQFTNKAVGGPFNESKRAFGKSAAAIGVSAALAPLIKLSEHLAPAIKPTSEVAKQAEDLAPVIKAASKHKFNSLKEYNDYLNNNSYSQYGSRHFQPEVKRQLAKEDEALYNMVKQSKEMDRLGTVDLLPEEKLYEFSPQAKAEMKAFKNSIIDPADEALRASVPHWSELLDDYIKWHNDIPF